MSLRGFGGVYDMSYEVRGKDCWRWDFVAWFGCASNMIDFAIRCAYQRR